MRRTENVKIMLFDIFSSITIPRRFSGCYRNLANKFTRLDYKLFKGCEFYILMLMYILVMFAGN